MNVPPRGAAPPRQQPPRGLSAASAAPAIDGAAAFVAQGTGGFRLDSSLTFATVPALHAPGLAHINAAGGDLQFDLQHVEVIDSAGLALLIDWLAVARARHCRLRYTQPPAALIALAHLSEVEGLIRGESGQSPAAGAVSAP